MSDQPTLTVDADRITITAIETPCPTCKGTKAVTRGGYYFDCGECLANVFPRDPTGTVTRRSAVIVVDGEYVPQPIGSIQRAHALPHRYPPEQVRRLTEPCQTCGGTEWDIDVDADDDDIRIDVPCPDCSEGRPTFTLHQRCNFAHEELGCVRLPSCDNGVIDLGDGWIIADVVPIVSPDTHGPHDLTNHILIDDDPLHATWWFRPKAERIILPPAARPGMFAVFAEQEEPDV